MNRTSRICFLVALLIAASPHLLWADTGVSGGSSVTGVPPTSQAAPSGPVGTAMSSTAGAPESADSIHQAPPSEDLLKVRDPFKRPENEMSKVVPKTDLEQYPVDSFKMVAVLTGPAHMRAVLLAPDGKSYFVAEKMKIGMRNGIVQRITEEVVAVREKVVNVLGQEENLDTEIRLLPEAYSIGKGATDTSAGDSSLRRIKK